jgi:hypothetical protein
VVVLGGRRRRRRRREGRGTGGRMGWSIHVDSDRRKKP